MKTAKQLFWSEGQCDWWGLTNIKEGILFTIAQRRFPGDETDRFILFKGGPDVDDDNPEAQSLGVFATLEEAQQAANSTP